MLIELTKIRINKKKEVSKKDRSQIIIKTLMKKVFTKTNIFKPFVKFSKLNPNSQNINKSNLLKNNLLKNNNNILKKEQIINFKEILKDPLLNFDVNSLTEIMHFYKKLHFYHISILKVILPTEYNKITNTNTNTNTNSINNNKIKTNLVYSNLFNCNSSFNLVIESYAKFQQIYNLYFNLMKYTELTKNSNMNSVIKVSLINTNIDMTNLHISDKISNKINLKKLLKNTNKLKLINTQMLNRKNKVANINQIKQTIDLLYSNILSQNKEIKSNKLEQIKLYLSNFKLSLEKIKSLEANLTDGPLLNVTAIPNVKPYSSYSSLINKLNNSNAKFRNDLLNKIKDSLKIVSNLIINNIDSINKLDLNILDNVINNKEIKTINSTNETNSAARASLRKDVKYIEDNLAPACVQPQQQEKKTKLNKTKSLSSTQQDKKVQTKSAANAENKNLFVSSQQTTRLKKNVQNKNATWGQNKRSLHTSTINLKNKFIKHNIIKNQTKLSDNKVMVTHKNTNLKINNPNFIKFVNRYSSIRKLLSVAWPTQQGLPSIKSLDLVLRQIKKQLKLNQNNITDNIIKKVFYNLDSQTINNKNIFYSFNSSSKLTKSYYQINNNNKLTKLLDDTFSSLKLIIGTPFVEISSTSININLLVYMPRFITKILYSEKPEILVTDFYKNLQKRFNTKNRFNLFPLSNLENYNNPSLMLMTQQSAGSTNNNNVARPRTCPQGGELAIGYNNTLLMLLANFLAEKFNKKVNIKFTQIRKPTLEGKIFAKMLSTIANIRSRNFKPVANRFIRLANINKTGIIGVSSLTGIYLKLGGRLNNQKIRPRDTIVEIQKGSLNKQVANVITKSTFINTNEKGIFNITVKIGHKFF